MLDDDIMEEFKSRAEQVGGGYQTLINAALGEAIGSADEKPLTIAVLRQVLREEIHSS